ncbi:MAG: response regulator [Methanomicrobia archaeon]|nr:response regulator [Methanomicrobia archaeon]
MEKNKILIVDDTPDNVKLLKTILKDIDCDIIVATDGEEALNKTFEEQPDLVLLDYMLPKLDGMKVLEKIKEWNKDIAVVIITAYGSERLAVETMRKGGEDYIINKPLRKKEVLDVVNRILDEINLKKESSLEKEENRNLQAYRILSRFERKLRDFFVKTLKQEYGENWWSIGIPKNIQTLCEERRNEAILRKKKVQPLLHYTDFSHYLSIILYKNDVDNWKSIYEKYFINIGWIKGRMIELNEIRNDITHPKPITEMQYEKLKLYTGEILEYMDRNV